MLYNKKEFVTQEFSFRINAGGELNLPAETYTEVTIVFKSKKFKTVYFPVAEEHKGTRWYWHVMGAIAEKITELEKEVNAPQVC